MYFLVAQKVATDNLYRLNSYQYTKQNIHYVNNKLQKQQCHDIYFSRKRNKK